MIKTLKLSLILIILIIIIIITSSSSSSSSSSSFIFKTSIFPHSARVRCSSRNEAPPHIPEHCSFREQTKCLHIILHTFIPSLPAPTYSSHPCHHHISTGRHPIIPTLTFHMPKPLQSILPHHLIALNPQKTVQIYTPFHIIQRHSAHPSHHHPFRSLQTLQIRFLHRPGLSPMSMHSEHKPCIFSPLCGMMHPWPSE